MARASLHWVAWRFSRPRASAMTARGSARCLHLPRPRRGFEANSAPILWLLEAIRAVRARNLVVIAHAASTVRLPPSIRPKTSIATASSTTSTVPADIAACRRRCEAPSDAGEDRRRRSTMSACSGVEFFVLADGTLVVNEIAPRVHNSGHWTEAVCITDQFEQHIRAIAGWPLGDPTRMADVVMENLIGDEIAAIPGESWRRPPAARLWQGRVACGPKNGPYQPGNGQKPPDLGVFCRFAPWTSPPASTIYALHGDRPRRSARWPFGSLRSNSTTDDDLRRADPLASSCSR